MAKIYSHPTSKSCFTKTIEGPTHDPSILTGWRRKLTNRVREAHHKTHFRHWIVRQLLPSSSWHKNTSPSHVLSERPDSSREPKLSKYFIILFGFYFRSGLVELLIPPTRSQICSVLESTELPPWLRKNKLNWLSSPTMLIQSKLFFSSQLFADEWESHTASSRVNPDLVVLSDSKTAPALPWHK